MSDIHNCSSGEQRQTPRAGPAWLPCPSSSTLERLAVARASLAAPEIASLVAEGCISEGGSRPGPLLPDKAVELLSLLESGALA